VSSDVRFFFTGHRAGLVPVPRQIVKSAVFANKMDKNASTYNHDKRTNVHTNMCQVQIRELEKNSRLLEICTQFSDY